MSRNGTGNPAAKIQLFRFRWQTRNVLAKCGTPRGIGGWICSLLNSKEMNKTINFKNILITVTILILGFSYVGCNKEENLSSNETVLQSTQKFNNQSMTLEEFAASLKTKEEIDFFMTHHAIDYTDIAAHALAAGNEVIADNPRVKIKFKWFVGCDKPFGICIIIPIGTKNSNAILYFYEDKCIIIPDSDNDTGLTSDDYLPVFCDIPINENLYIKEGIYKAYYDWNIGKYAITVDLVRK